MERSKVRESVLSLCGSCLCFFFNFRCCVSAIHFSSHCQQSLSSLFWHNTTGKRLWLSHTIRYFRILEILYDWYFMTVQNKKPLCALLILSSETILIITRRKMNVLCPTLRKLCASAWYLFLRQKSRSFTSNWKKSTTSKITTMEF